MSNLANPYQAPQEDEDLVRREPGGPGAFHVLNGSTLVAEKGAVLPAICLWNGEACHVHIKLGPAAAAAFARVQREDS